MTEEQNKIIIDLYISQCKSMKAIAKEFNVDPSTIKRILVKNNIEIRSNNFYKSKKIDTSFFKQINSPEKAYILGFLYADGYVTKNTIGIKLGFKDYVHLKKIHDILQSEHSLCVYDCISFGVPIKYAQFAWTNKEMAEDLIKLGCVRNKSLILKFPNQQQVPEEFLRDFIRGYFDGDGSVYLAKTNIGISFTGTQDMLEHILAIFKTLTYTNTHIYKYKDKDIYELKLGGNQMILPIYHYLYDNAALFLERKKERFDSYFC